MTAEIALLNRSALALAADSAVTLRIGSTYKTYNSAEKIFEYSCRQPLALMIYNNAEFIGVPFDVLIRKHREECKQEHQSMRDAADHFLEFLLHFDRGHNEEKKFLALVLVDAFSGVRDQLRSTNNRNFVAGTKVAIATVLNSIIEEETRKAEAAPLDSYLSDKTIDDFNAEYGEVCDQAFKTVFKTLKHVSADLVGKTRALAFALIKSSIPSEVFTGLVFGGFAKKDLFPTLHYLEIDGIFFNKIKVLSREEVDIDRSGHHAQIVPFAQREMADRFIYGIDEDFNFDITNLAADLFDKILALKPKSFTSLEKSNIRKIVRDTVSETLSDMWQSERQSILDIVNFMSKKELAEMAAALVEVTSAKRRFSVQQETVGGPIDVAVVSRNEGFVWIRRKHYFEQDANQGYFARVFPRKGGN